MWSDFGQPQRMTFAETAVPRERARSKKRRKPSRSKRKSTGTPHVIRDRLTSEELASNAASSRLTVSMAQVAPVPLVLETIRCERLEAPQEPIQQGGLITGALDSSAALTFPSQIKHHEVAEIDVFAVPSEVVATISHDEMDELPPATSAPSVLVAIELRSPKERLRHVVLERVGLATMGLVGLFSALWLIDPAPHTGTRVVATTDQAPVSSRVWTDPVSLERARVAVENSPIAPQPKQEVVAPTGLAVVQKGPSEEAPHTDLPAGDRLVGATSVASVAVSGEVGRSVSVPSVPLPPRRPASLLIQHMPVVHPVSPAATVSLVAPTVSPVEQTEPLESYASFSARKHEIGTHKLPWGMARLHEDPNSESSRGVVWDFVPSEP